MQVATDSVHDISLRQRVDKKGAKSLQWHQYHYTNGDFWQGMIGVFPWRPSSVDH